MSKKESFRLVHKSLKLRKAKLGLVRIPRRSKVLRGSKFQDQRQHGGEKSREAPSDESPESLAKAIILGDFTTALTIVSSRSPPQLCTFTSHHLSPLHLLAYSTSPTFPVNLLEALIRIGCHPSSKDAHSQTLLHLLVLYERCDDLERCIGLMKDVIEERNDEGRSPLHEAALRGSKRAVEVLLAAGASVNAKTRKSGLTPLQCAVLQGAEDVVERLLQEEHVRVNETTAGGCTALDYAKENNSESLQNLLISKGAVKNVDYEEEEEEEGEEEEEEEGEEEKEEEEEEGEHGNDVEGESDTPWKSRNSAVRFICA